MAAICSRDSLRVFVGSRAVTTWFLVVGVFHGASTSALVAQGRLSPAALTQSAATPAAAAEASGEFTVEKALERLVAVKQQVEAHGRQDPPTRPPQDLLAELEYLNWLDLVHAQRLASERELSESQAERDAAVEAQGDNSEALERNPQQYSFLRLDDLRDELASEQARLEASEVEVRAAEAALESVRRELESSESSRRKTRESLETDTDTSDALAHERQYQLARIRSLALREGVRQHEAELENHRTQQALSQRRCDRLRNMIGQLEGKVPFPAQELEARLAMLKATETDLRQKLSDAQLRLRDSERQWLEAKRQLAASSSSDPVVAETVATRKTAREACHEEFSVYSQMLRNLVLVRSVWQRRYELAHGKASPEARAKWDQQGRELREEISQWKKLLENRLLERRSELTTLRKRLLAASQGQSPELSRELQARAQRIEALTAFYIANQGLITSGERLLDRFLAEVQQAQREALAAAWSRSAWSLWQTCWNYELTAIDDRPITVKKIVIGVALLCLAYSAARVLSRLLGSRILPRVGINQGAVAAFQSILFYLLFASFGFVALEFVNVPLTVFAFMGGAIAIGIGFGSQNVLNNFISGLILLAERPIRVGDLVEIDGRTGTVENIGARSTRLRTGGNAELLVPNSKFLENSVTNWTLSDSLIRSKVSVGAAYGSPTRVVSQLLRDAVDRNPQVRSQPAPFVIFRDFGDNALVFEVHYWIQVRSMTEAWLIETEIRHTIDDLFRQARISIAFPQRDVHLDVQGPIEVQLREPRSTLPGDGGLRRAA